MKEIEIFRENNFQTMHRPFKVYVDGDFIDFIEPKEKTKKFLIEPSSKELKIEVDKCSSNSVKLNADNLKLNVTSQIQNGLFVFIYTTFFGGLILMMLDVLNNLYLSFALLLPFAIIVYWQTLGRKNYLRISKMNRDV
ncbi:hypothetical protein H7U19_02505 [Hyunsoonleella sp. SJ7]|uniref:Uncharacterized protein n=1 Tax=Hyunsoonleella aquatilis TaxID=2762758 RepID=A0A923HC05_9FLAO|nr:hypothetical protein [Hyunsoonleella aquatilis]MBC3757258.1 hypothetical protein [Hyunsoonleella aquatilis]